MRFEVEGLSCSYAEKARRGSERGGDGRSGDGRRKVVEGVSFSASSGDTVSLVGPNGVGKSTLLRCMLGLLPASAGRATLDGRDVRAIGLRQLWSTVGYVPQTHRPSLSMSVLETVLLGRSAHIGPFAQPSEHDEQIAREALEGVGLEAEAARPLSTLSGGQQRLVLIAKALATEPGMLVLDEPESGLDYRNRLIVVDLLERLANDRGMIVVTATHYPENALRVHGKVLLLEGPGRATFGPCDEVLTTETMSRAFGADIRVEELDVEGETTKVIVARGVARRGDA